MKSWVR